jgi:hypothetical protein
VGSLAAAFLKSKVTSMRKIISLTLSGILAIGLGFGLSGCTEESASKSQTTQTTPGGKTVETQTNSVKQSGENPPAPTKNP